MMTYLCPLALSRATGSCCLVCPVASSRGTSLLPLGR